MIHAPGDKGRIRVLEAAHRDPRMEPLVRDLIGLEIAPKRQHPVLSVLQTGNSELMTEVNDSSIALVGQDEKPTETLRQLGMRSVIVTPLVARGRAVGALTVVSAGERQFNEEDLKLAEELGRRAAIAIDNARLYREAQEANRAKADFLAVVSHELRTPLNAIIGYSDLLDAGISGDLTEPQHRQLGRIRAAARHLLQLIEEILAYARIESGGAELELQDATIQEIVDDAMAVIEPMAMGRNLPLKLDIRDGGTEFVTDVAKTRQILVNLLSNAVKFTERGEVELSARATDEDVIFAVRDTGPGIAESQLAKIFDAFWQAERPTTRRVGGTGLGLSVAQRFARLLNGEIGAESRIGEGSTFTLTIPRNR